MKYISPIDDREHRDSSVSRKSFSEFLPSNTAAETRAAGSTEDALAATVCQSHPVRTLTIFCVLNQIWTRATPVAITYVNSGLVAAAISACTLALAGQERVGVAPVTKKHGEVDDRHAESNFDHQ